ncbi:MAG: hypothetical protein KKH28_12655 [Elusimicrobia bacterium]|nr:hypothetical protein [Elusimicrobiota bacterium]
MIVERKTALIILSLIALCLISVPTVIFNSAVKKYFNFMGHWSVAAIKPSKTAQLPPMHGRIPGQTAEMPQPELHFVKFTIKITNSQSVKAVKVEGDFNKWNPDALILVKKDKNLWATIVPLPPGVYHYLYNIDGQTILDPMNPETAALGDRKVSVLTVK